jgi:predicted HTH transcriptional regulator
VTEAGEANSNVDGKDSVSSIENLNSTKEAEPEHTDQEPTTPPPVFTADDRIRAREKKRQIKKEKLEEILKYVEEKGEISNDEVEKIIEVSDTTAAKYLKELVRDGKLEKIGRGWQTRYMKRG